LIEGKGYKVDHKKKAILDAKKDRPRRPKVTLDKAKELTKPKPLTEEQKKKRQQAKQKKAGEKAFLKTVIPKPPPVSKPSKGVKVGKPPPKPKKDENKENREGWKKYFKIVEDNKELLKNNKIAPPFRDSYSFYKTNADVSDGKSNMNNKWSKWIDILEKEIKKIKMKNEKKEVKKDEPKKKEEPKKQEPIKNERYKITEKFMKDNDIFSKKFLELYKESGEQTPEFKKLYKQKQRLIAKYKSENSGQSITTELKKLKTPWLKAWIESDDAYEKFLKRYKTYPLISKNDNFLDYLKTRIE
jgi:hypothetical protein